MIRIVKILTILILLFLFPRKIFAQVVINEINPTEEWVELFNLGTTPVILDGCTLYLDDNHNIQKIVFSTQDKISDFLVVGSGGNYLNNNGDDVSLECVNGNDNVSYGSDVRTNSYGRSPDGTGDFYVLTPSRGGPNPPPATPTPTLSPLATPTVIPIATPIANATTTPTPKPSVVPTQKPTSTPLVVRTEAPARLKEVVVEEPLISSGEPLISSNAGLVLGSQTLNNYPVSSMTSDLKASKSALPFFASALILVGASLIGIAVYLTIKKEREGRV